MIIPEFEHVCGTINPQRVVNLRADQTTFKILTISVTCTGCGKQHVVHGLKDKDDKSEKEQPMVSQKK